MAGGGPARAAAFSLAACWAAWFAARFVGLYWAPAPLLKALTASMAGPYDWSGARETWIGHGRAVGAALLLIGAAAGWGRTARFWSRIRGPLAGTGGFALGLALLGLTVGGAGALGLLYRPVLVLLGLGSAVSAWRRLPATTRSGTTGGGLGGAGGALALAGTGLLLALYLLATLAPELGWDALTYHLHVPARYLAAHRMHVLPHCLGSFYPFLTEQWFIVAAAFGGDGGARLVNWGFLALTALVLARMGDRLGHPAAGRIAGLLYVAQPAAANLGTQAYNDLETAFFALAAVAAALERGPAWRLVSGALCGALLGCKYTGLWAMTVCAVLWARDATRGGWSLRALAEIALPGAVALALFSPWPIRDWAWTGNPVFPLLAGRFPDAGWNPYFSAAQAASIVPGSAPTSVLALAGEMLRFPADVSLRMAALGVVFTPFWFGFLPAAFLRGPGGRPGAGKALAMAGLAFCAQYIAFKGADARYLLPGLALLALPAGLGAVRLARGSVGALAVATGIAAVTACQVQAWTGYVSTMYVPWRVAVGAEGRHTYLNRALLPNFEYYMMAQRVNGALPPAARIMVFSDILGHYYDRATVFDTQQINPPIAYRLAAGCRIPATLRRRFRQLGLDYVLYTSRTIAFERSCHCLTMEPPARAGWRAFWRRYAEPVAEAGSLRLYRLRGEGEAARRPPAPFLDFPGIQDPALSVAEEARTAGRWPEAEGACRALAAAEPGLAMAPFKLAEVYLLEGKIGDAAQAAARARRLGLDSGALRLLEAGIASARGDHARAYERGQAGAALWPSPRAWAMVAAMAWNDRKSDEAKHAAAVALRLNPYDVEVRRVTAVVH